jgi:hypothetical protein
MVQYLGAVPSHLLSSLGIMTTNMGVSNYTTVPNLSALLQSQPLQTWEPANQIVILPQQPVLSFNLPSVSLQSAPQLSPAVATIQLSPAVAKEASPVVNKNTSPKAASVSTPLKSVVEPKETVPKQNSPKAQENEKSEKVEVLKEEEKKSDIPLNNNTLEEGLVDSITEGKPPKPTYSYRSAMGGKKPSRTITPVGNEAKDDQPSIVKQLKVVAHPSAPDKAPRTFHLKASSDEQERLSITEEMVEMVSSRMTEAAVPEMSDKLADITDVFATPPASSEPPILPSDLDVEPNLSWPIIDSTLSTEEAQPQKAEPEIRKKKEAHILYELVSDDGFYAQSNSLSAVWQKLLDAVQDARLAFKPRAV